MEFRWLSPQSDKAAATMVVARVFFKGMSIEKAIDETLHNGELCHFPDQMPEKERIRFRMLVDGMIEKTKERRQQNAQEFGARIASA